MVLNSEGYFPALLSAVQAAGPSVPFDPVILQSLLLCLVAPGDNKYLVVRAKDEDVSFTQNLTAFILARIFGYSTQKVRVRSKQSTSEFLHSLFIHERLPSKRHPRRRSTRSTHRSSSEPIELTHAIGEYRENKHSPTDQTQRRPRLRPGEAQTDSATPTLKRMESSSSQGIWGDQNVLPKAIVFSGLEHSSTAQRALLQVLTEKCVVFDDDINGVWTLPEDLMIVYVCPVDLRERPKIHLSLLDRFAMSVTVSPAAPVRQGYATIRSELQILPTYHAPIISSSDLEYLRSLRVHFHPSLSLYMDDLFTAARHHHELDGIFLTARAHKDSEALILAHRILSGDSTGTALIRSAEPQTEDGLSQSSRIREQGVYDEIKIVEENFDGGKTASRAVIAELGRQTEYEDSVFSRRRDTEDRMDVSEVDVAKIVPRVISHRLRVRDGPENEIFSSVMYPAVPRNGRDFKESQRRTTKDIVVSILSDT